MRHQGKFVVVTGSASITARFRQEDARVCVLDVNTKALLENPSGEGDLSIPCDVSSPLSVQTAFDEIASSWGRIDILLGNLVTLSPVILFYLYKRKSLTRKH